MQEGASFGAIMLMGQISGIVLVILFEVVLDAANSIIWPMVMLIALSVIQIPFAARMKESTYSHHEQDLTKIRRIIPNKTKKEYERLYPIIIHIPFFFVLTQIKQLG